MLTLSEQTMVRMTALPVPMSAEVIDGLLPAGESLDWMVRAAFGDQAEFVCAQVNRVAVPRAAWAGVFPQAGDRVILRLIPQGGGDVFRTVLSIAVVVVAAWAGPAAAGAMGFTAGTASFSAAAALSSAAFTVAGSMVINALVPPGPQSSLSPLGTSSSAISSSPTYSLSGARNELRPFGPVPYVIGRHRITPDHAAKPYVSRLGQDQYLHLLFDLRGHNRITDIKVGETPVGDLDDVEIEIVTGVNQPVRLYPNDVDEQQFSVALAATDGWQQRRTASQTDRARVTIGFPRLIAYASNGTPISTTVNFEMEWSVAGANAWQTYYQYSSSVLPVTARMNKRLLVDYEIVFPARGQYDIRIRRTTADAAPSANVYDQASWILLQSITYEDPIKEQTYLTKLALRIKATGQLNGVIDNLSFVAEQRVLAWDQTAQAWVDQYTSNPAAWYRWSLQNEGASRQVSDDEIDLATLEVWAEDCTANGYTVDHVVDYEATTGDILRVISAAGRAAPGSPDGRFSVVMDRPQSAYAMHLNPSVILGYRMSRSYARCPHGFRVRFINAATWQWDERVVYDDGYNENNATIIEALELPGIVWPDTVYKFGRFHLADIRLRPETHYVDLDWRHLRGQRGDLVDLCCDIIKVGLASGWIKGVVDDGTHVTALVLDRTVALGAGVAYAVRVELHTGARIYAPLIIQAVDTETDTVDLLTPIAIAGAPGQGNLWSFGELGKVSMDMIIKEIEPGEGLTARLTLVPAAPEIHAADQGTIPAFDPLLTRPRHIGINLAPIIESAVSAEAVLLVNPDGTVTPRLAVNLSAPAALSEYPGLVDEIEVQWRVAETDESYRRMTVHPDAALADIGDVFVGATYQIRCRYIKGTDFGPWVYTTHTVIGDTSLPPDVSMLWVENNLIRWTYDPPRDFSGFEVRHRTGSTISWEDATKAHDGLLTSTVFDVSLLPGGVRIIMVKAVDRGGRYSSQPAYIIRDLGDPAVANIIFSYDLAAEGFPGIITNGSVVGGVLQADFEGTLFWPADDNALFWPTDNNALFWDAKPLTMTYEARMVPDADKAGAQMTISQTIVGEPWQLLYKTGGDSRFWPADDNALFWPADDNALFWNASEDWRPWPGSLEASRQEYRFMVITAGGTIQGAVSAFTILLDVPDIIEQLNDVVLSAAGTRLPITKQYRAIAWVKLTLQDDGGGAVNALLLDKGINGPLVQGITGGRVGTAATIDAEIGGY